MIETRIMGKNIDILIIAEGTYPFIKGGVAAWIYDIIKEMPDLNFGIIFLGASQGLYKEYAYPIPNNLVHLQLVYLFDFFKDEGIEKKTQNKPVLMEKIADVHEIFKQSHGCPIGLAAELPDIGRLIQPASGFDYHHFLRSQTAWDYITQSYESYSTDPSFLNYFWNIRNMHVPLWALNEALEAAPSTRVLHTISTGYAGLLAAMLHQRYKYPLILSEHGIYNKERNIELLQTKMFTTVDKLVSFGSTFTYQHELWLKFYDSLSRTCYQYANSIISLFEAARIQQIALGAESKKTQVIPNGVDINKFSKARRVALPIPKIVCFVGRMVRIKDIKTFIRAIAIMLEHDKEIEAWIRMVGEGDSEYINECLDYINLLDLKGKIHFINDKNMVSILSKIGVLVLSSISEGMPLVLLEALAAGVPVIATDVGSCREIIEGLSEEDKLLGCCGEVINIADATMLSNAAIQLLNNPELWLNAQQAGIKRVERYYDQRTMIDAYQKIYQKAFSDGRHRV